MKLHDNAFSPFARKVRMVLELKGLAFESIDALGPEGRDALARVNPRLEVPVLEDDGLAVVNSSDIVAYLEHRYPTPPVYPADATTRARARAWERLSDTTLDAVLHDISLWRWPILDRQDAPPPGLLDAARANLDEIYARLEAALADGEYLSGALSIADLAFFPHLSAVRLLEVPFSADRHPRLLAWYKRMRGLPLCQADLARVQRWLSDPAQMGQKIERVVWRGDRIEWLLAHGFHEWLVGEIRDGRVAWPRG